MSNEPTNYLDPDAGESPEDPDKNTLPSPPQQVSDEGSLIVPDNDDVPEDDSAEPEDADVDHSASEEDVEESS